MPHSPYYGAIDTTPLFLVLFCELMDWLDDDALYRELMPAVRLALDWIDRFGDLDGDGYLEWRQWGPASLYNQAWKDSHDSYFYPDGSPTEQPTASAEIQGYVYDAKLRLAALYGRKGEVELGAELGRQAAALRERFNRDFWVAEEQFFAQALDGQKRQVTSVSTNPGHCLWSGLLDPDRAAAVAKRLLADDLFSGWGVRTLSSRSPRFNPMSYHNGSIWPHDNSLIAAGLRRYGHDEAANTIITGIFRAGLRFHELRLPELFCGFTRDEVFHSMPAEYPVACNPQAWAAGSPLLFVRTILGLQPDAARRRLTLRPRLPDWLDHVRLTKVQVGPNFVDLIVSAAGVETTRNTGEVEIVVE
ncbi:MAG: hypothetical protein HY329_05840 [Chloroflexi bacterium]|nr:hypothetical protein [Chloroflexota bacterium]